MNDARSGLQIQNKIDPPWVQKIAERFRIVSRAHTGK